MATPVSWLLVEPGWRVEAADGTEIGRIEEVTGDSGADIFDGLSIASSLFAHPQYVPAEQVGEIVDGRVRLKLTALRLQVWPSSRSRRSKSTSSPTKRRS